MSFKQFFLSLGNGAQIAFCLAFVFLGLLLTVILTAFIGLSAGWQITDINYLRLMQNLQGFFVFILPALLCGSLFSAKPSDYLDLSFARQNSNFPKILIAILVMPLALPLINFLAEWNASWDLPQIFIEMEQSTAILMERFLAVETFAGLLGNIFMIALLPAIGEELLFRGFLQKRFLSIFKNRAASAHLAIWLTAIIFSAIHLQMLGFVPRLILGALLGYLAFWGGNLWFSIIAHFVNNALAVILSFCVNHRIISEDLPEIGKSGGWLIVALSVILVLALMTFFARRRSPKNFN